MKSISIFIISFILLFLGTTGYAVICPGMPKGVPAYYCNCQPATGGTCQCNASNGHPIVNKEGQPIGNIKVDPNGVVGSICCTAPGNNIVPDSVQPPIRKGNPNIFCYDWGFPTNAKFASFGCGNSSLHTNYITLTGFNCTNSG